ncbi:Os11g0533100, partial [Oryza sativa Japonica Group]
PEPTPPPPAGPGGTAAAAPPPPAPPRAPRRGRGRGRRHHRGRGVRGTRRHRAAQPPPPRARAAAGRVVVGGLVRGPGAGGGVPAHDPGAAADGATSAARGRGRGGVSGGGERRGRRRRGRGEEEGGGGGGELVGSPGGPAGAGGRGVRRAQEGRRRQVRLHQRRGRSRLRLHTVRRRHGQARRRPGRPHALQIQPIDVSCRPHEKQRPRNLSKLNDPSTWEKRRLKGKLAVQKMVVNLMELYLQRMRQKRPPYPKPVGMDQFTAEFPYEPTPDQNQAFIDVDKDLTERETPMDRLICGDVGFGKTEVAMRAIFIVISAGFQAMVLAPTVILAKQHYDVMSERFSNYPDIKVAMFSGAQTKEEKDELITKIRNGDLHIIVGTHAVLTERMAYNNLGLLVVDEEQKFGVQQKEKIASYKASIDVLTLSATPIPRTLYLALTGFRDASLMSTPPPERVAVRTYVSGFSKERALSAIKFELARGGQVFYVVPRIKAIDDVLQFLKDSLPDVPMAVAHGKKVSKNIQLAMEKFACGEVKILVCTHIIESGIDIPNANTMVVQYAELFGLAQLYQLRGRVGRSGTEGFAYLFYTDKSLLSKIATDRLGAIEEHSDLGQGFHVAEKDMGIRGFGSLFGEQQSGDVANVGIDLFFDMLFDSLSKVDQFCLIPVPYKDVQLDINISSRLSSEYISYLENPVELLNEAAKAAEKDLWTLIQFTEDLRRQYGKEPRDMELLLKKLYVRRMAADLGISRIYSSGKMIIMKTNMNKKVFRLMREAMSLETHRNSLSFTGKEIKGELLVNLPDTLLLNWLFHCLADCYAVIPALVKY